MFGGAPIQMQPGFAQPVFVRNPAPAFVPPVAPRAVPNGQAYPQPAPPSLADGRQEPSRPPVIRFQAEDEPVPAVRVPVSRTIAIPSPEELGVSNAKPAGGAEMDWGTARRRLQILGADFQLSRVETGYHFVCLLPTSQPGRIHRVEAEGASEGDVVLRALDEAEKWVAQK